MKITWNELTVKFDSGETDLLGDWRWLIGDTVQPVLIAALGDVFLQEIDDSVWWLDIGAGQYSKVVDSSDELEQAMVANVDDWFAPQLVGDLLDSGLTLGPNQCFSFKIPPILGGKYEPANLEPTDLAVHFSILGQIHQQVKDLPEGTPISSVKIGEL